MTRSWLWRSLPLVGLGVGAVVACGDNASSEFSGDSGGSTGGGTGGATTGIGTGAPDPSFGDAGEPVVDCAGRTLAVSPAAPTLEVNRGDTTAQVAFQLTENGAPVSGVWSVDRGEIGSVAVGSGVFVARGSTGGRATVTATFRTCTVSAVVTVKLKATMNGETVAGDAGAGAGGYGGVGGEGPGGPVAGADLTALTQDGAESPAVTWLYPYEQTVFPRGTLPPLLQWRNTGADVQAIRLRLDSATYSFDGTFGRPVFLTSGPYVRHPIPREVWDEALRSNEGDELLVRVTLVTGTSTKTTVRLPERRVKIAKGPLKGTVYYNSYGTQLAKNFSGALISNPTLVDGGAPTGVTTATFGAAVLGIRGGSEAPQPIAIPGDNGSDSSYCRTCHAVASGGGSLIVQAHTNSDRDSWRYTLSPTGADIPAGENITSSGDFTWPAISPDGTVIFTHSAGGAGGNTKDSRLFVKDSAVGGTTADGGTPGWRLVADSGIPAGLRAAFPAFSKDGRKVVFTFFAGTVDGRAADKRSLAMMDFDPVAKKLSNFQILFDAAAAPFNAQTDRYAAWASFLPTHDAVVFQYMVKDNGRDWGFTRSKCEDSPTGGNKNTWPNACHNNGARAELWYVDLATKTPRELKALNGKTAAGASYLPTGPNCHGEAGGNAPCNDTPGDDTTLAFEPTANPVVSGGYAWVVFMSRRMYGNVATLNPWHSDPRFRNLTAGPTPKKLWVAAIDLNPAPGADPSHPAFYLPAQELSAGNARGYWVVDPCKAEGNGCQSGDECCGGFCRPQNGTGALVCTDQKPTCAQEFERCEVDTDCCAVGRGIRCINKRCAGTIQ